MNKSEFLETINVSDKPVLVDFWAPWCSPCRMTKPILEKLATEYSDSVSFRALNADEHPALMKELMIIGIPTVMVFPKNEPPTRLTGAKNEKTYRELFEKLSRQEQVNGVGVSSRDRWIRLGLGTLVITFSISYSIWWISLIGGAILFSAIYDRCPIWQAFKRRLKLFLAKSQIVTRRL